MVPVPGSFYTKDAQNKDVLWDTLADWAAALVENEVRFHSCGIGLP